MAVRGKLTKVEAFYIQGNRAKTPEELSKDLKVPKRLVEKFLAANPAPEQPQPEAKPEPKPLSPPEKAKLAIHESDENQGLSVVMTQAGSEVGDRLNEAEAGRNQDFFDKRLKNAVHVMDPKRDVR
jgi:hypothetical protein